MKKNEKNQEQAMLELKVTRELLDAKTKSGDDMYGYVLKEEIVVNGQKREIRVDFAAKDIGGYDMLDIIFRSATYDVGLSLLPGDTYYRYMQIFLDGKDTFASQTKSMESVVNKQLERIASKG